jgi:hypothetical protein
MDEQWSYHSSHSASVSSGQYSVKKSTVKEVQDRQHCQPQGVAYFTDLSEKEIERRRKIGAANKGKVPWTKGRKWSEGMLCRQFTVQCCIMPFSFNEECVILLQSTRSSSSNGLLKL